MRPHPNPDAERWGKICHARRSLLACHQPPKKWEVTLICKQNTFCGAQELGGTSASRKKTNKKNPLAVRTELETNLFQAAYSHTDTNFCSACCAAVSECLFSWREASQLVITSVTVCWLGQRGGGGMFHWRVEWPAGRCGVSVQMDALNLRVLVQWSVSQHLPRSEREGSWEGLAGSWDSREEVQRRWTITRGLTFWDEGKQEVAVWLIQRGKNVSGGANWAV